MNDLARVHHVRVSTPQGDSGELSSEDERYLFTYSVKTPRAAEISLLMPLRAEQYTSPVLHPIFQMNLPEGYVLEQLRNRLAKATPLDPMLLLALTGREAAIGRVRVEAPELEASLAESRNGNKGESLKSILAWDGAENLFNALAERYLLRTGVSGVQPKLLVPEMPDMPVAGKASLPTSDLIVKSGGADYPGLAINEYVCMSAARAAGLPVPEFYLSNNHQLFVMRRFDRSPDGASLGFEDMAALMGKGAQEKYDSSYERVARFVELYCAEDQHVAGLAQLFDQVALSCILGNGDAHLKNFGVLYSDPSQNDVRLAPVYDIVNTTAYIRDDQLALTLGGSKSLFASRLHLIEFAARCRVNEPVARIRQLLDVVETVLGREQALLKTIPQVNVALNESFDVFATRFPFRNDAS
jgi:serine/threonine-protein kinase HipA